MAKPCRYQLPGTDTWMSESEFKKALNDGLIDKFMTENNISVRGLKPKAVTAPVEAQPAVETPATPVAETKTEPVAETKAPEFKKQSPLDDELDSAIIDMENIEEEIAIEKDNIREEKERIKEEKAKVRASKMSRAEKQDKLEDLDAELEDYIDNAEGVIENYKDDLKYAKSRVKKLENRKAKEQAAQEAKPVETKTEPVAKEEAPKYEAKEGLKESGYSPNDNIFNKPGLAKNKNYGWRTMSEKEFNDLASGKKTYEGGAPKSGNWIAGVPQSAAKFGKSGTVMVEFGGINMQGSENMEKGSKANKSNVTKVWKFNNETKTFEESPELLNALTSGSQLETPKQKTIDNKISDIDNEIDDIQDRQIPALEKKLKAAKDEYSILKFGKDYSLESIDKLIEDYKKEGINFNDYLSDEQRGIIEEMRALQNKSDELESKSVQLDESIDKEKKSKPISKQAPKKMIAPGRTKQAFDRNFTVEISADGTTATVQGEAIETADGRKLTPPKETVKITTNINGERVGITSKGDTVYLDRAKEVEEKQVDTTGKTGAQIKQEYMEIARQSNGDYAIVYSRTGDPLVYKKNRRTGKWQGLTDKGEWIDANENRNAQANDAVNYTRKDRKMVKMSTVKNGVSSVDDFVYDFNDNTWKKLSEDGSLSSVGKELAAKAEERFVLENPKRAPKTKEEIKQRISDIIDGAKADEGLAMSSLIPIPPKYWNKILDLVKEAMFKGVDFSFAVNDAARKVFGEAIKNKEITRDQANEYINAINDEKSDSIPELTAIKKEATSSLAQEIAEKGIDRMSYSDAFKIAEEAINNGEINPDILVQQVIDNPRPLNAIETAVFTYSKTKLSNELKELYDQFDLAKTENQKQSIDEKIKLLSDKMLKYDIASNIVGYIQGLSLSIRRVMLNADYDLVLPQIKKIYEDAGKEMPEGLEQKIKEAQKEFRRLNREIEKLRGEVQKTKEEEAVENIKESTKKTSKKKSADSKMTMSSDGKIAVSNESIRNAVINGATEIEDVIDAVRDEVLVKFPNATDRQIRDAISNYGKEVNKTKDEIKDEINRIKRVGRIISKLEDVQKQKGKVGKIKNPSVKTKAINILNLRESELKRALKEAMSEIPVTEQEMKDFQQYKLDAYKKSLKDRNAELERRIKEGDFSSNKRTRVFDLDQEARNLESERQALIEEFEYAKTKAEMETEPLLQKLNRSILSAFNLPKGLIASIDVSAPFRQGIIFMMTQNPLKSAQQLKQMFGFWASPKNYDKWLNELKSSEYYPLIKESGLYISEQNGKLSAMEEVFANNLGNKIPILGQSYKIGGKKIGGLDLYKRSEAAYSGFLNNLRVQSFMEGVELLKQNGYTLSNNKEAFKDWANYVNSATGRGNMDPKLALKLGPLFFSPRLIKARLEQIGISDALSLVGLSDGFYMKMSPPVRAMALKRISSFLAVTSTMIGLAALYYNNDDDDETSVELDPRSSDFAKIRFGNTRIDITGGFITFLRAYSQAISGKTKNLQTKQIENLNEGYGKKTRFDVLKDFYSNKLSPFAKKVYDYTAISDEERERRNLEEETQETKFNELGIPVWVQDLTIPLWMRDVEPIMKEQGTGTGMFLIGISLLGEGVQYFEPKYKAKKSSETMDFDFNDSEGIGDFNEAGGFGDFNDEKGIGDFN